MNVWDYLPTFARWLGIVGTAVEPEDVELLPPDIPATPLNERYSYRDFTGLDFTKVDPREFNRTTIIGTCFSQLQPLTKVFPTGIIGISFVKCNLDNVDVPVGNTMRDGCNRQWKVQNDMEPWIVSGLLDTVVEPLYKDLYAQLGISVDPADIPDKKLDEPITATKMAEASASEIT